MGRRCHVMTMWLRMHIPAYMHYKTTGITGWLGLKSTVYGIRKKSRKPFGGGIVYGSSFGRPTRNFLVGWGLRVT